MKTTAANKLSANLAVTPATKDQQPVLANLLELYVHDFSEFLEIKVGADGRFGYEQLPLYWQDPKRHPFLIRVDGSIAGFALVKQGSEVSDNPDVWDMAEFFVLRVYRRHGIGTAAAHAVWKKFPGQWEVRVMQRNDPATHFWAHAVGAFTGQTVKPVAVEKNSKRWGLFSFSSPRTI
jgi:predicted acetyltransferase